MRSYGQFCAVSRGLDVIGDRWTLLIVRELLMSPARYSDLRRALPNVATNLLSDRLRELEGAGLVRRETVPPPTPAVLYALTDRGRALEDVLFAVARWAGPLMLSGPGDDVVDPRWPAFGLRALFRPELAVGAADLALQLVVDGQPIGVTVTAGALEVRAAELDAPDDRVEIALDGMLGLLAGTATTAALGIASPTFDRLLALTPAPV